MNEQELEPLDLLAHLHDITEKRNVYKYHFKEIMTYSVTALSSAVKHGDPRHTNQVVTEIKKTLAHWPEAIRRRA